MTTIDNLKAVIAKLPHSESRVPYTYHHDYLRSNAPAFAGKSRGEVAMEHTTAGPQLYALALLQLLNDLGARAIWYLEADDLPICKAAFAMGASELEKYAA